MSPAETAAPQALSPSRVPRWIEDTGEISRLLTHAAGKRLILAVGGNGGPRNSLLLSADAQMQQLVIDPPFPSLTTPLEPGLLLSLSTRIDGAVMDFTAPFEQLTHLGGEEALVLRWPQRVRYLQRRAAYRLGIPRELHVPPAVLRDRNGPFTATLVDLSRFGAGALVPRAMHPHPGESLDCTIRIGETEFTASAEVRSCIASLDRLRLGLEFGEISPVAAAKLSAAVAQLERVVLRRAANRKARE